MLCACSTIVVKDAEGSIENQVDYLKAAKREGYDVILCSPVSAETVVELKASAGDIPIVFINSCPDEKQLKEGKYVYAGSDEYVAAAPAKRSNQSLPLCTLQLRQAP